MTANPPERQEKLVEQVAALAMRSSLTVGVAESLTGGQLSAALASGDDAATWFRGSVVAYAPVVKFHVLGVQEGPVNSARCANQMVNGALDVLECDVAVAVTGVGGPGPDEGVPPGTVFIACGRRDASTAVSEHHMDGSPLEVLQRTVELALASVAEALLSAR